MIMRALAVGSCLLVVALSVSPARAQGPLVDHVPEGAVAAALLRRGAAASARTFLDGLPELKGDLSAYLRRVWGVDLTEVQSIVLYSSRLGDRPSFAALLMLPPSGAGTLKGKRIKRVSGVDLVQAGSGVAAALVKPGLLIGSEEEVAAGIARARGAARPIRQGSRLAALLAPEMKDAELAAAVHASGIEKKEVAQMAARFGIEGATLRYDKGGQIVLSVHGDPGKLDEARQLLLTMMGAALGSLKAKRDQAMSNDDPEKAVPEIAAYHLAKAAFDELSPKLEGDRLVSRYQLPGMERMGATLLPVVGLLSAIAIPAFVKYQQRAGQAESTLNLRRMADGAIAYHAAHSDEGDKFSFPASTPWSPSRPCCQEPERRCAADPKAFRHPTWEALGFSLEGSHHFQYRFTSEGRGQKARFVVEARGDVTCGGQVQSLKREGRVEGDHVMLSEIH